MSLQNLNSPQKEEENNPLEAEKSKNTLFVLVITFSIIGFVVAGVFFPTYFLYSICLPVISFLLICYWIKTKREVNSQDYLNALTFVVLIATLFLTMNNWIQESESQERITEIQQNISITNAEKLEFEKEIGQDILNLKKEILIIKNKSLEIEEARSILDVMEEMIGYLNDGCNTTYCENKIRNLTDMVYDLKVDFLSRNYSSVIEKGTILSNIFNETRGEVRYNLIALYKEKSSCLLSPSLPFPLQMSLGGNFQHSFMFNNTQNKTSHLDIWVDGEVRKFINITCFPIILESGESGYVNVSIYIPPKTSPGLYYGDILIKLDNSTFCGAFVYIFVLGKTYVAYTETPREALLIVILLGITTIYMSYYYLKKEK